jgi:hypothetical protein
MRPIRLSRRTRRAAITAAAAALLAAPAYGAFTLDGTSANIPGNLQPSSEPAIVLGGLNGRGAARVPWIAQVQPNPGGGETQVFVEKFANGQFSQQGDSLNFNPFQHVSHPDIDFAGANFSVPWSAWEEDAGGISQIFASRFLPNADKSNGIWEINGALRSSAANSTVQRGPSINFNPDKGADEPRLHGGTLQQGGTPSPWVIWKEDASVAGRGKQIFVSKGVADAAPGAAQRGPFTWHIQGTDRGASPAEAPQLGPTLNVQISDTIDAVHPDITFTGPGSTVPWAVWYEEPNNLAPGATPAAPNNQRVFAAKFVPDPALGDRAGRWVPVGNGPGCVFQTGNEDADACALNTVGTANAENPNVAAGSLDPAKPTVPWVAWHEATGPEPNQIFLSRLNPAAGKFDLFAGPNANGSLNADPTQDADEPDLFFEANVLHVTWKETVAGGKVHTFARRFTPGAGGVGGQWSAAQDLQVEPSLDSGNAGIGTFGGSPFVTWAEGAVDPKRADNVAGHLLLKHEAAVAGTTTIAPTDIGTTSARLNGAATGDAGVFAGSFLVTQASGQTTVGVGDVTHNAGDAAQSFSTGLTGLQPNSVVRVRSRLTTALGSLQGDEIAFVTAGSGQPGTVGLPAKITKVTVRVVNTRRGKGRKARVSFTLDREWRLAITSRKGGVNGKLIARVIARFPKGRSTVVVPITKGRFTVILAPRAGGKVLVTRRAR